VCNRTFALVSGPARGSRPLARLTSQPRSLATCLEVCASTVHLCITPRRLLLVLKAPEALRSALSSGPRLDISILYPFLTSSHSCRHHSWDSNKAHQKMASAAAVAADAARSPIRNDIGDDEGVPGEVTSAIGSKEDGVVENGDMEENDEDDVRGTARRRGPTEAGEAGGEEDQVEDDEGGDDLFGDEDDEAPAEPEKPAKRQLDDEELDSGDDMDRNDRAADGQDAEAQEFVQQEKLEMNLEFPRQPLPEPSDGEVSYLYSTASLTTVLTVADVPTQSTRLPVDRTHRLGSHQIPTSYHRSSL
jgi:hypothetical protein